MRPRGTPDFLTALNRLAPAVPQQLLPEAATHAGPSLPIRFTIPRTIPRRMKIDVISEFPELERLAADWLDLCRRSPGTTPFQTPMWLLPWRRAFGSDELVVITAREGVRLDSLAPLTPEKLVEDADKALYRAKANGRNRMESYSALQLTDVAHRAGVGAGGHRRVGQQGL